MPAFGHVCRLLLLGAYSAGADLGLRTTEQGLEAVHVHPRPEKILEPFYMRSWRGDTYSAHYEFSGRQEDAENLIRTIAPDHVLLGSGAGVQEYQYLAQAALNLGIPLLANNPVVNPALIDKAEFYRSVKDLPGIFIPPFIASEDPAVLAQWAETQSGPLVLKPSAGGGTVGGRVVDPSEVFERAGELLERSHGMIKSHRMILMPYLGGEEYAVNIIFRRGDPLVTGVWSYKRKRLPGALIRYEADWLMDPHSPIATQLISAATAIARHQGLKVGALHIEFKILPDGKIVPLDPNPRLPGGGHVPMETLATGRDPRTLYVASYTDPNKLDKEPFLYTREKFAVGVFLSTEGNKRYTSAPLAGIEKRAKELGVELDYKAEYEEDAVMVRTVDADTVVGWFRVVGPSEDSTREIMRLIELSRDAGEFEKD